MDSADQGEGDMSETEAFIAATRFGLGAKDGDVAAISPDPRGWLTSQLDAKYVSQADIQGPPNDAQDQPGEACVMMCASPAAGDDQPDAARTQRLKEILAESNKAYLLVPFEFTKILPQPKW